MLSVGMVRLLRLEQPVQRRPVIASMKSSFPGPEVPPREGGQVGWAERDGLVDVGDGVLRQA